MKPLNKGNKIIIFTLLLIVAFVFSNYGQSVAKYYKNETDSVTYNLGFDALTKQGNGNFSIFYDESTHTQAYFRYAVARNDIMTSDDLEDKYRIVVNPGCEIKKVNNKTITGGTNVATFDYQNNVMSDIVVEYSCPVSNLLLSNSDNMFMTSVTLYEQMTTDYKEFIYLKQNSGTFKVDTALPPEITANYNVLTILDTDNEVAIKNKIENWLLANVSEFTKNHPNATYINNYINNLDYLNNYLKKAYTTDIKNFNENAIRGIKFTQSGNSYSYEMSEEFIAYALTDAGVGSNTNATMFYFADVTKSDAELNAIFEYYVDKYLYNKTSADYATLMNYINTNGGAASVLKGAKLNGLVYSNGRLAVRSNIMSYATATTSVPVSKPSNSVNNVVNNPSAIVDTPTVVEETLADKIINNNKEIITNEKIKEFIKIDKDLDLSLRKNSKFNDYIIYEVDKEPLLINIYTDEKDEVNVLVSKFDENVEINFETVTKISLATEILEDKLSIVNSLNELINIIDTKYATNYANIITVEMIDDSSIKGLYTYEKENIIKAYLKNEVDETEIGTIMDNEKVSEDENNGAPDITITDDPDDVTIGDTPNDDIPIFDDLVTTEPSDEVVDPVVGENETETENPEKQEEEEQEEEKDEEVDDNGKNADTDIEKEFVNDIEEVEKLIEDMKEFVGDAEEISEEDEAIAEVDELIETVKDYINEA